MFLDGAAREKGIVAGVCCGCPGRFLAQCRTGRNDGEGGRGAPPMVSRRQHAARVADPPERGAWPV